MLWARYAVSFLASSIHYFLSNSLTNFIRNNRRHIGLSFALAHTIHLVALTSFFVTTNQNPDIVTVLGGGLAYLAMYIMAFTSNDNAVRKIGFKRWKLIHKLGANYIAFIFAFTYLGRLTKEEFSSVEFNLLFSIIIGAFALRVYCIFLEQGMRINVVGTAGSGKSTFAKSIAKKFNAPYVQLDEIFWKPNWKDICDV